MTRAEHEEKFRAIRAAVRKHGYRWLATPIYQDFLTGERKLSCAPWGSITRNPYGWKGPCYLLTDGIFPTYEALLEGMEWEAYGPGNDPALRALRHPLRLRAVRGVRVVVEPQGDRPEHGVDVDGMTPSPAPPPRRSGSRGELGLAAVRVGVVRANGVPEGPVVSFGLAGALHDGLASATCSTRRASSTRPARRSGKAARSACAARAATIVLASDVLVHDAAERRRLHESSGADAVDMESGVLAATGRLAGCCARSATCRRARSRASTRRCTPTGAPTSPASRAGSLAKRGRAIRSIRDALAGVARARGSAGVSERPRPARRAALVLRRRRPGDRDRRAAARAARPARLRPSPDRPQRARRPPPRGARRGVRRGRVGDPGGRDLRPFRPRRRAVGEGERARRAACASSTHVCPLVYKVHAEARRYADSGHLVALVGHANHVEVIGTIGERPGQTVVIESPEEARELERPTSRSR